MVRFASIFLFLGGILSSPKILGDARRLYEEKSYPEAVAAFNEAIEDYPTQSPEIWFNIGQCWLATDSSQKALDAYGKATSRDFPMISSLALTNAGVIAASKNQKVEEALEAFKEALRRDPDNELARYNYELLKHKSDQQQQQQDQKQEQKDEEQKQDEKKDDKNKQDGQKQKQQQKPQENKGEKAEYKELSPEQAKMILEGMKENEKQYLQQLRRHPRTKPEQDGKPAW